MRSATSEWPMEDAVAASAAQYRASACTAGGYVSPRFALPRVASRVRSRQPAWAASAARRGPSARRNGCKNCRALCCRVLRSGLQSRVKRSAQGKKGTRPRVIAQSALHIYMGTPLRARPRHRVIVRVVHTIPANPGVVATETLVGETRRARRLSKARPVSVARGWPSRGRWTTRQKKCGDFVSMAINRLCKR